jgi:23S rRNA G2069 N7-methylase RlmK/C1962 C5-methylase RlmI
MIAKIDNNNSRLFAQHLRNDCKIIAKKLLHDSQQLRMDCAMIAKRFRNDCKTISIVIANGMCNEHVAIAQRLDDTNIALALALHSFHTQKKSHGKSHEKRDGLTSIDGG